MATLVRHLLVGSFRKLGHLVNDKVAVMGRLLARNCKFIAMQRVRRTGQTCSLYSRLYGEGDIQNMIRRLAGAYGRRLLRQGKSRPLCFLLGSAFFSWDQEKITDEEMKSCAADIDCATNSHANFNFSSCSESIDDAWEVVIDREHLKVWRKAMRNSNLYEYKVFGTFYDVPAWAFFDVQLDIEYRKKWDKLVISLDVVEKDQKTGCEVIHWVMHYPFPMYSRDYVYIRKHHIDETNQMMVLVSKATEHPCCPISNNFVRVTQYSSSMVVKPHSKFNENGFDYVLTYFDDPKAMIPSPAYSWMASSGVPDFVEKLHHAAVVLKQESAQRICMESRDEDKQQTPYHQPKSGLLSSNTSRVPVYA